MENHGGGRGMSIVHLRECWVTLCAWMRTCFLLTSSRGKNLQFFCHSSGQPRAELAPQKFAKWVSVLQHFYSSGKTCLMVFFFLGGGGCSNAGCHIGKNIIFIAKLRIHSETGFRFIWWTWNLLAWLCHIRKNYHKDIIVVAKITKEFGKWLSLHVTNSKFTCMIDFWKGREARRFCVNRRRRFVIRSRGRFSVAVAFLVRSPDWPIQFLLLQPISAASKPPWRRPWRARRAGTVSGLWGGEFRRLLSKTRADSESGNPTLLKENHLKIYKTQNINISFS
jgi:hypothetical protein